MNLQVLSAVGLILLLSTSGVTRSQVTVTALGQGLEPLQRSEDILYQHADFTETASVTVGLELQVGDLLTTANEDLFLELSCPQGSKLDFTGAFQVLINPPLDGLDCAVDVRAGKLDVLTDGGTEIQSGEVTLGTEGTRYAVRLDEESETVERVLVFDGTVRVETPERTERVTRGRVLHLKPGRGEPREVAVTSEEIDRWANLYARFNAIQAKAAGADPDLDELTRLHARVLRKPDDRQSRIELADVQDSYRLAEASYHRPPILDDPPIRRDPSTEPKGTVYGECDIYGVVTDRQGAALPGVEIVLSRPGITRRTTVSDSSGRFRFPGLWPGTYRIEYALDGFSTITSTIDLESGPTWIDVAMSLEARRIRIDGP